jgi:hypothetical protein
VTSSGKKPKLVLFPHRHRGPLAAVSEDDFAIYASYRIGAGRAYIGTLKVVRKTDSRLLFPFDGAPAIGPFATKEEAIFAAQERGREIALADLKAP